MKKQFTFSIWYVVLGVWGVLILHNLIVSMFATRSVAYSEFLEMVQARKVAELLNRITTLLGGRAAEEIIYGDVSTGAHNDLSRATDIARSMVSEYGMSDKLGQVYYAPGKQSRFLNVPADGRDHYSEQTAMLLDEEIKQIIDTQYQAAIDILISNRQLLETWAERLLDKEVIEGALLEELESQISPHSQNMGETKRVAG